MNKPNQSNETAGPEKGSAAASPQALNLRSFQQPVFEDRSSGILILHWSRQIGKSYVLAAWAVDRICVQLLRYDHWLVTVLSNSRDNGAEFVRKCDEICRLLGVAEETSKASPELTYKAMHEEIRLTRRVGGRERTGRIKVLAANPRTARGFSGDLILDEFAFHENSGAIWEAAEPILSANAEYLCRIASTGNGKHNLFYRMCAGQGPHNGECFTSAGGFKVSRVSRTAAAGLGVLIFDPNTRRPIAPGEARRQALDKRAYDQNYECVFADENMCLLTHELIQQAERAGIPIDHQAWGAVAMGRLAGAAGDLFLGGDLGRERDITVFVVLERAGAVKRVIALLRLAGLRLPDQQRQLDRVCVLPRFRKACIDMTGLGLGLVEYAQEKHGDYKVQGINFATTEPISDRIRAEGRRAETARVTELLATELLGCFEDRSLEIAVELDQEAREDLRKPEKVTSPGGRVSIAAVRDGAGHADHFWALALAVRAAASEVVAGRIAIFEHTRISRVLAERRDRSVLG
jgi:phage FluMu gp28-like protein